MNTATTPHPLAAAWEGFRVAEAEHRRLTEACGGPHSPEDAEALHWAGFTLRDARAEYEKTKNSPGSWKTTP